MQIGFFELFSLPIRYRSLITQLVRREITARTSGTWLGGFWLFCQPALQVFALWFLFDQVLKVRALGQVPYLDYFFAAILPWMLIQDVLSRVLQVLTEYAPLYQRTPFPLKVLPLLPLILGGLIYTPIFILTMGLQHGISGMCEALWLSLGLLVGLLPACYLLALMGLFIRSSRQLFPFLLTFLMYVSPILYQPEALPEPLKNWIFLNPIADVIAIIQSRVNGLVLRDAEWLTPLLLWILLLPIAGALFSKAESLVREEL